MSSTNSTSSGWVPLLILGGVVAFAMFSCETSQKTEAARKYREAEACLEKNQMEAKIRGAEQRAQYLQEYHPQVKVVREELVEQLELNQKNKARLAEMFAILIQDEAKIIVHDKLKILSSQEGVLQEQIRRIDNEAEKGMVVRTINKIDGGGVIPEALKELTIESSKLVENTRMIIAQINGSYNTGCRVPSLEPTVKAELVGFSYMDRADPGVAKAVEPVSPPLTRSGEAAGLPSQRVQKAQVVAAQVVARPR